MTKQLKLGALIVAAIASANAMASEPHGKDGYVISRESREALGEPRSAQHTLH